MDTVFVHNDKPYSQRTVRRCGDVSAAVASGLRLLQKSSLLRMWRDNSARVAVCKIF